MSDETPEVEVTENPENVDTTVQEQSIKTEAPPIDIEAIKQAAAREVAALYMGALSEKEKEIERLRNLPSPVRQVEEEVDGAQFLNAPKKHISEIVQRELQQQLAPIQELWGQFSKAKQLEQAKNQLGQVENYREILTTYGDIVDQLVGTNTPTLQSVEAAVLMVPGLITTGRIPMRGSSRQDLMNKSSTVSPSLTPSSPTPPKKSGKVDKVELSDNEREIARRMGMSADDYVKYRDNDSDVSTWGAKK